jgi:hypothetical protein
VGIGCVWIISGKYSYGDPTFTRSSPTGGFHCSTESATDKSSVLLGDFPAYFFGKPGVFR